MMSEVPSIPARERSAHREKRQSFFVPRAIGRALVGDAGFTVLPIALLLTVTAVRSDQKNAIQVAINEFPLATIVLLGLSLSQMVELQLRTKGTNYHPQTGIRFLIFGLILIAVLGTTFISGGDEGKTDGSYWGLGLKTFWSIVFLLFALTTYLVIHVKRESLYARRRSCPTNLDRDEYFLYLTQSIENARREILTIAEYYRKSKSLEALASARQEPRPLTDSSESDLTRSMNSLDEAVKKMSELKGMAVS